MPELPEVETVCTGLRKKILGHTITEVQTRRPNLRIPIPKDFAARLTGQKVVAIRRRAKYVLLDTASGDTAILHLGMSGKLFFPQAIDPVGKHDHIQFSFGDKLNLVLNDPRRFGLATIASTEEVSTHPLIEHLGPEPLSDEFTPEYLKRALKSRKTPIKVAIMDGKVVVGVGNIYASEALFRARINPNLPANSLSTKQASALTTEIKKTLEEAIAAGGSSLRDYVQTDGSMGYFQHGHMVYGRAGQKCKVCGTKIEQQVLGQRSTFHCPSCQKLR